MSVFKALQKTLLNVQRDVSTGLKSLTTGSSQDEDVSEEEGLEVHGLDVDAGSQLLERFQENWTDIHLKSEENAKKAKHTDAQIGDIFLYLERQNDAISQFLNEVSVLPSLVQEINGISDKLERIEATFESVETELLALEDLCEHQTLVRNTRHHTYQLSMYQQKKNVELEKLKVRLAADHSHKVKAYEKELQQSLREKQEAFEATYREEMKHYRQFGQTSESFKPTAGAESVVDLGDIPVSSDTDRSELDAFLQSEDRPETETTTKLDGEEIDEIEARRESSRKLEDPLASSEETPPIGKPGASDAAGSPTETPPVGQQENERSEQMAMGNEAKPETSVTPTLPREGRTTSDPLSAVEHESGSEVLTHNDDALNTVKEDEGGSA